jgi:cell division GTPase FtsZ
VKEKIGFLAIGQAGGNIGILLQEKGYAVLFINTSKEDLDTLDKAKYKYHISGGEGCNRDRHKAKQLVIDDYDNIAQEIDNKINRDIIYCIFASGGGTGSGAGPMLMDLLIDDGKKVGAITVIPSINEPVKRQINFYECYTELEGIENSSSIFSLDNDKGEKMMLNPLFVDAFVALLDIPDKHKNEKGNIDKAEIKEALFAHGASIVITTNEKDASSLFKAIDNNIYAPLENDRVIKYITLSSIEDLNDTELEKVVGITVDTFQTYNDEMTICMLSGLSYPKTRLEVALLKIEASKDIITKNLAAPTESSLKGNVNFLGGCSNSNFISQVEPKHKTKRDITNKYLRT